MKSSAVFPALCLISAPEGSVVLLLAVSEALERLCVDLSISLSHSSAQSCIYIRRRSVCVCPRVSVSGTSRSIGLPFSVLASGTRHSICCNEENIFERHHPCFSLSSLSLSLLYLSCSSSNPASL